MSAPRFRARWALLLAVALANAGALADEPTPEADFAAANERALAGDDAGAIALYQHLVSRGVAAADLHYNLGVALAHRGHTLEAILAWERALRLDPAHADARANLAWARKQLPQRASAPDASAGAPSAADALEPLAALVSRDAAALALALAWTVACSVMAIRRLGALRGRATAATLIAALIAAGATGALVIAQQIVAHDGRAVVTTAGPLKEGAHQRFQDVAAVSAGERVRVLRAEAGWIEVQATDGVTGWVTEGAVERL